MRKNFRFYFIALLVCVFTLIGVVLADTIVNNYYGNVDLEQTVSEPTFGGIAEISGICDGSEPTTQLCNVNIADLSAGSLTEGGDIINASSSLSVGITLTAAQMCDSNVIHVTPDATGAASLDITLSATSTLFADCLIKDGNEISFLFCNESATAASTTQIVAGTGMDLVEPDGQDVEIAGGACARITATRYDIGAVDAIVEVDELIAAD